MKLVHFGYLVAVSFCSYGMEPNHNEWRKACKHLSDGLERSFLERFNNAINIKHPLFMRPVQGLVLHGEDLVNFLLGSGAAFRESAPSLLPLYDYFERFWPTRARPPLLVGDSRVSAALTFGDEQELAITYEKSSGEVVFILFHSEKARESFLRLFTREGGDNLFASEERPVHEWLK